MWLRKDWRSHFSANQVRSYVGGSETTTWRLGPPALATQGHPRREEISVTFFCFDLIAMVRRSGTLLSPTQGHPRREEISVTFFCFDLIAMVRRSGTLLSHNIWTKRLSRGLGRASGFWLRVLLPA